MKSTVLAIACLLSVGGLGCVAEVEDPEDQSEDQSAEVSEAEQALGQPCAVDCRSLWRQCLIQGNPPAECYAQYQACLKC